MAGIAPGKTFIPGLDFSSQSYSKLSEKVEADVSRAHEIIKEKLPLLAQLNALISLTFGDHAPVFVDARSSEAKFLDSCSDEPDTKVTIKPENISQFYEGKLEPRYGLFKDAFFHEASMPKGNVPIAIKFADLLTPNPPVPPKKVVPGAFARLPEPTEDIDQVKRDIKEFGYGERKAGVSATDGGPDAPNQRIWTLINKGEEFLDLLNHPLIDEIVPWFLGEHALIHSYSANIARPGNVPMQLHTDQVAIQPPVRELAFGLNIMWYLEDITEKNGGTRVFPASHLGQIAPDDLFTVDGTVAAEGPSGTALVFDSRLWHATGPNREESGERPVILIFFMRSFIRQQENNFLSLRKDVEAKLSDRHKRLLGFCTTGALGGIEGEVREGIFVTRKDDCVGTLRAAHE
ncbi:hypothetical protein COL516b_005726 [Colletotrichum fioriniae]|nr:uncharacterized protein COL516b_005726 [Colletotrichum fioriniae]KAJ0304943.1 hypothetical protein COL516b_005726 [Colletotrichum fioriniae]